MAEVVSEYFDDNDEDSEEDPFADARDEESDDYHPESEVESEAESKAEAEDDESVSSDRNSPKAKEIALNPFGLNEQEIYKRIISGTLYVGSPPQARKYKSSQWQLGMKFLYSCKGQVCENWYICSVCGLTYNQILSAGTANMLNHVRKHTDESFKLDRNQLAEAIYQSIQIGKSIAINKTKSFTLGEIKKMIPSSRLYSNDFLSIMLNQSQPLNMMPTVEIKNSSEVQEKIKHLEGEPTIDNLRRQALIKMNQSEASTKKKKPDRKSGQKKSKFIIINYFSFFKTM